MIYLDHHAAAPLAPAARAAMQRVHELAWANPSSIHAAGRAARAELERARRTIAGVLEVEPADLVFTSGGTEACNLGVLGLVPRARHVLSSALEHPAVLGALDALAARGTAVELLPLADGAPPSPDVLARALRDDTDLVALQWVNHETGTVAPIEAYAATCRARSVPLLVDASQAVGKLPCSLTRLGAAAVVVTASKLGGPAGAAALYVERGRTLAATSFGGAQERGRRAGTPDVAALAGFAAAAELIPQRLAAQSRIAAQRDALEATCRAAGAVVNGAGARVATVSNLSVPGWRGEILVAALDVEGLCASSGAACSSGLGAPSPVLRALYPDQPWRAECALRLSLGPELDDAELERARTILQRVLTRGP